MTMNFMIIISGIVLLFILEIMEIAKKIKGHRVILDSLGIVTAIAGLIISLFVFLIDNYTVDSSILMVVGTMIVLSIPFNKIGNNR